MTKLLATLVLMATFSTGTALAEATAPCGEPFAGVTAETVPISPAQLEQLERLHQVAAHYPYNQDAQRAFVSYAYELQHQRVTPEALEIVPTKGAYAVVGKATGRLYRVVPIECIPQQ